MVERIARLWLLEPTGKLEDNFPLNMRFDNLNQFLNCVSAAIEAMREPTDEMVVEAEFAVPKLACFSDKEKSPAYAAWRAMIDAALGRAP